MLAQVDVLAWYERIGLSNDGRAALERIRSSDPARRVGGGSRNVSGRYPSKKMGVTIQFESHRVELAAIHELEHDPDVLEYFDQPPTFKLDYRGDGGRRMSELHTADFFVIRQKSAGWEECKTEEELMQLTQKNPRRYVFQESRWTSPPGEAYAAALGFYYRVRSSQEIDWVFQRNILFLEDYLRAERCVPDKARELAQACVSAAPELSLEALLAAGSPVLSPDDIYSMIAAGILYVDLHRAPLTEPSAVLVFANKDAAARAPSSPPRSTDQRPLLPQLAQRLAGASERELRTANARLPNVTALLRGDPPPAGPTVPTRTLRRWAAAYRTAEKELGSGYLGLLPRPPFGNASPKLPEDARTLMNEFIATDYESVKQKTMYASWISLKLACEQKGILTPSLKTFCVAVRQRPGFEQTLKRQGHRAAYAHEDFFWELTLTTPRHGDRPFEIAHIDHTELDVETVCSRTGRVLVRPWLTLLSDAFSRRILALYLTFDPPSYRSCMMVLRECVSRHARLPQILVMDGGSEFQSVYFETLLARYECTKKTRPAAKPRFGSVCERLFQTTNTQFIHNLKGNTQITRLVRQVTPAVNPKGQAVWPFGELHRRLTEYAYEIYDTLHHPALGQSPREAYDTGLAKTGHRTHKLIAYDREFLVHTLPTTVKGTAKVAPGRGIKIRNLYYWSDVFRAPDVEKQHVAVRYDPFDAGTAYAFVHKEWTECHSEYFSVFHGRSEKEIMLATQELRKTCEQHSAEFHVSARKLAEFLQSVETEEVLLAQRRSDLESCGARPALTILPPSNPPTERTSDLMASPETAADLQTYGSF
jgi:transposase InsO family protein